MYKILEGKSYKTKEYDKFILEEMIKHSPLRLGKLVEVKIAEGQTPLPEITEIPIKPTGKEMILTDVTGKQIGRAYKGLDSRRTVTAQISDKKQRKDSKFEVIQQYTDFRFAGMFSFQTADIDDGFPLSATLSFIVRNPEKIYQEAEKLGIKIIGNENLTKKIVLSSPEFLKNRSKLIWGDKEITIERDSMEFDLCRYAFKQKLNEFILWSDVMEKMDHERANDGQRGWRTVYDLVGRINKKTKLAIGKPLFRWGNKGFYRIE